MSGRQPQKCSTCMLPGHQAGKCMACKLCCRPGHNQQYCPFSNIQGSNFCSKCRKPGHHPQKCLNKPTCGEDGCTSTEWNWLHPHKEVKGEMSLAAKANIHGTNRPKLATGIPDWNSRAIYSNDAEAAKSRYQKVDTNQVILSNAQTDSSLIPKAAKEDKYVITNYVAVNKTPKEVFVYDIVYADIPIKTTSNEEGIASSTSTTSGSTSSQQETRPISQLSVKKRIFQALSQHHDPFRTNQDWATDYTTLWSLRPLFTDQNGHADLEPKQISKVTYSKQGGKTQELPFVEFRYNRALDFSNGSSALVGKADEDRDPAMLTRALNAIVVKHVTSGTNNDVTQIGANKFFMDGSWQNIFGIHVHRGFYTSIRPGSDKVLLNINVTHASVIEPLCVSEYILKMEDSTCADENDIHEYGKPHDHLRGKQVRITYERPDLKDGVDKNHEDNRKKVIAGFGSIPQLQEFSDGVKNWTVREWFESQGATLHRPVQKCANVGLPSKQPSSQKEGQSSISGQVRDLSLNDKKGQKGKGSQANAKKIQSRELYIPAEFLELVPMQPFPKKLGPHHMEKMLSIALQGPSSNQLAISAQGLPKLGIGNPAVANELKHHMNFETGSQLLRVPATFLPAPTIKYAGVTNGNCPTANASWDMKDRQLLRSGQFSGRLYFIDLRENLKYSNEAKIEDIARQYFDTLKSVGMIRVAVNYKNFRMVSATIQKPGKDEQLYSNVTKAINQAYVQLRQMNCTPADVVFVILNDDNAKLFNSLKRYVECGLGINTLFVTKGKVKDKNSIHQSILNYLALKHNIKLGGQNHTVLIGAASGSPLPAFQDLGNDTVVIAADVVHFGGELPSIAAVFASRSEEFDQYPGSVRLQAAGVEIIGHNNIYDMSLDHLRAWARKNQRFPKRLLYYRDGVGESQYDAVLDNEVLQIQQAYDALLTDGAFSAFNKQQLSMSVVVVEKRHHTRFFAPDNDITYRTKGALDGNVKPGLIVDNVITYPQNKYGFKDFFLQSHVALAGTAKSARYVVLRNDDGMGLSFSKIQEITFAFCYNYARATKGVSYASPTYYADRLCDRVARYLASWREQYVEKGRAFVPTEDEKKDPNDPKRLVFKQRVCDAIAANTTWCPIGRNVPWDPRLDDIMFYL